MGVGDPRDAGLVDRLAGRARRCPRRRRCPAGSRGGRAGGPGRCRRRRRRPRRWCGSRSSVSTKPRSIATPCSSYPSPSVAGPRPTATSSSSASITSPPSTVTATPVVGGLHALERRAGAEGDLALAEGPLEGLRGRLVLGGDQAGERLDDGDLGAEGAPHAGELAADDAAAEHDHRGRHPVEAERVLGGDDPLAVDLEAGQGAGVGAGGEHDVRAGVRRVVDGDLRGPVSRPAPSITVMPRPLIRPVRPLNSRATTPSL